MIKYFSFENVGKAAAVFNPEKLLWLNSQYIINTSSEKLVELVKPFLVREEVIGEEEMMDKKWLSKAIDTLKERSKTLIELAKSLRYYIAEEIEYDEKARAKFLNEQSRELLIEMKDGLSLLDEFTKESIERLFRSIVEKYGVKLGLLAQPVRVALTGSTASPGIFEVIDVLGKEKTIKRLEKAIGEII